MGCEKKSQGEVLSLFGPDSPVGTCCAGCSPHTSPALSASLCLHLLTSVVCVYVSVDVCEPGMGGLLRLHVSHTGHVEREDARVALGGKSVSRPLRLQRNGTWNDRGSLAWDCLHLANLCKLISYLMWSRREQGGGGGRAGAAPGTQSALSGGEVKLRHSAALVVPKV